MAIAKQPALPEEPERAKLLFHVTLPNGTVVEINIRPSINLFDLKKSICAQYGLNPLYHTIDYDNIQHRKFKISKVCTLNDKIKTAEQLSNYTDPSKYNIIITYYVCSTKDNGETAKGVAMFSDDDMKLLTEAIAKTDTSVCYNIMIRKEECYRRLLNVSSSSLKDDHDTVIIGFKIISEDKTCTNSIYKAIIAYYHGASKRCRVILEH